VKKTITIFLLLVLCVLSSMAPLRVGLKQAARVVMQGRLKEASAKGASVLIAAGSIKAADWESRTEFRRDGILYDVSGIVSLGGERYYRCINDQLEARLEQGADNITTYSLGLSREDANHKLARSLIDWLQGLYFRPLYAPTPSLMCKAAGTWHTLPVLFAEKPSLDMRIVPPEA
jgi:hypothetical protein